MAIDSEDKRRSVAVVPPVPDSDLDSAADRMHIAGFYRGITPAAPPVQLTRPGNLLLLKVGD